MQRTIDETTVEGKNKSRIISNIIYSPNNQKSKQQVLPQTSVLDIKGYDPANPYAVAPDEDLVTVAAEEQAGI